MEGTLHDVCASANAFTGYLQGLVSSGPPVQGQGQQVLLLQLLQARREQLALENWLLERHNKELRAALGGRWPCAAECAALAVVD